MTTQTQPSAGSDAPGGPEPRVGSSVGLGDIVRAYVTKVRGGDLGSLPAILGLIVLVVVIAGLAAGGDDNGESGIPPETPPGLKQPLEDLHDAVLEGQ